MTDTPISREQANYSSTSTICYVCKTTEPPALPSMTPEGWSEWASETPTLYYLHTCADCSATIRKGDWASLPPLNSLREPRLTRERLMMLLELVSTSWNGPEGATAKIACEEFISAILATSPPIQGEGACPTNHKAPNGESWSEIEWFICVGGEDYEKWTSATSNRAYDHCPDCGQPLSSPVKEGE